MPNSIREISALRVFFMLMIFVHHINFEYGGGGCVVACFFLISGFCLTLGYENKVLDKHFNWKHFMQKRALRLYPLHWITMVLVWLVGGAYVHWGPKFIGSLGLNALLLQSWVPIKGVYFSFNSPSWYLCDILFFAAVFPFIIRVLKRMSATGRISILIGILVLEITLSLLLPHEMRHAWLYIHPINRLTDCVLGVYLALAYLAIKQDNKSVSWIKAHVKWLDVTILLLLVLIVWQSMTKFLLSELYNVAYWPLGSALLLTVALRGLSCQSTWMSWLLKNKIMDELGACSLAFYLLHTPVMKFMGFVHDGWGCDSKSIVGGGVCLFATIMVSMGFCHCVEPSLVKLFNRKINANK